MNCVLQMIGCLSYSLEWLGVYEPKLTIREAKERLNLESNVWKEYQGDRALFWNVFQIQVDMDNHSHPLILKALDCLKANNSKKGVAVDLGCGLNTYTFDLLDRGWKVYAVDSSDLVLKTLAEKVSLLGKNWIQDGQLVLVNQTIEEFKFPEKVHLITAIESLPYCDPEKIVKIFLEMKSGLLPQGVLVCNLFPYDDNRIANNLLKNIFGGWMTTKNVVDALVESIDFKKSTVTEVINPSQLARQFHVVAEG